MIRLADGAILGVINKTFHDRHNLTLVISRDAGADLEGPAGPRA
jgi:hypothetical protein